MVKSAFRDAKNAGIDTFAYFIIGYINETEKTMQATIDLAKEINPKYVMFTKAVPLPNTPLMYQAVEQKLIDPMYWSKFTLGQKVEPIQSLVPNADKWVRKAYRSFYLRPSRMIEQILGIRSFRDIRKSFDALIGILSFKMNEDDFTVVKKRTYQQSKIKVDKVMSEDLVKIDALKQLNEFELKTHSFEQRMSY